MGDNKEGKKQPLRETIHCQLRVRSGGEDAAELLLEAVIWVTLVFFILLPKLKSPGSGGEELHTHTPATKYLQYARQDAMHLARPHSKSSNCTAFYCLPLLLLNTSVLKPLDGAELWDPKAGCKRV